MRPRRGYTLLLEDISRACEECFTFVEGMAFEEFIRDRKTQLAVVKEIEIIGEAAGRIPDQIRDRAPGVPWPAIVGMRNLLAHEYFQVNYETVWNTVQRELLPLQEAIRGLLGE